MPKMRKLTIDRRKWDRATKAVNSGKLLNSDGLMCCLGFECRAIGFTKKAILNIGMPSGLISAKQLLQRDTKFGKLIKKLGWLVNDRGYNTTDVLALAEINDNSITTDDYKENKIVKIFAKHNVKVVFTH